MQKNNIALGLEARASEARLLLALKKCVLDNRKKAERKEGIKGWHKIEAQNQD